MSTTSRFQSGVNNDNTFRSVTKDEQSPAANQATLAVTTAAQETVVNESIAAAQTINMAAPNANGAPYLNDEIEFQIANSAGTASVVTFGSNMQSSGTGSIAAGKNGSFAFRFNGTVWVEKNRALTV